MDPLPTWLLPSVKTLRISLATMIATPAPHAESGAAHTLADQPSPPSRGPAPAQPEMPEWEKAAAAAMQRSGDSAYALGSSGVLHELLSDLGPSTDAVTYAMALQRASNVAAEAAEARAEERLADALAAAEKRHEAEIVAVRKQCMQAAQQERNAGLQVWRKRCLLLPPILPPITASPTQTCPPLRPSQPSIPLHSPPFPSLLYPYMFPTLLPSTCYHLQRMLELNADQTRGLVDRAVAATRKEEARRFEVMRERYTREAAEAGARLSESTKRQVVNAALTAAAVQAKAVQERAVAAAVAATTEKWRNATAHTELMKKKEMAATAERLQLEKAETVSKVVATEDKLQEARAEIKRLAAKLREKEIALVKAHKATVRGRAGGRGTFTYRVRCELIRFVDSSFRKA